MRNGSIINQYGTKKYFLNDLLHREDGPAFENKNGDKEWRIHGYLHREDGPAVEYSDGDNYYYLDNHAFGKQEYWEEIKRRKSLNYIIENLKGSY